mmetsp:Transcript_82591/g.181568  ORF Transcript_82591/g.181568 Transcript_82591/m.181568 type:complete len:80 (+) Transcript_82591:992-1231(+)
MYRPSSNGARTMRVRATLEPPRTGFGGQPVGVVRVDSIDRPTIAGTASVQRLAPKGNTEITGGAAMAAAVRQLDFGRIF